MRQPIQRLAQRRTAARQTGTYTFWYRRPHATGQVSAWMLSQSAEEAAFLTTAGNAPRLGEQLELAQPHKAQALADGAPQEPDRHLPKYARVVRLGEPQGVTRRVAIRFD